MCLVLFNLCCCFKDKERSEGHRGNRGALNVIETDFLGVRHLSLDVLASACGGPTSTLGC